MIEMGVLTFAVQVTKLSIVLYGPSDSLSALVGNLSIFLIPGR